MPSQFTRQVIRIGREQLKILDPIILLILVAMVNHLAWVQAAPKMLLHHKAVLKHVGYQPSSTWVIGCIDKHIVVLINQATTLPISVLLTRVRLGKFTHYPVLAEKLTHARAP